MEFAKANLTPKAVSMRYFTKERDHWKCKCGKVIQQKTNKATRTYSTISKEPTPTTPMQETHHNPVLSTKKVEMLFPRKKRRLQLSSQKVSEYGSLKILLPTSNILERFFSSATYSSSDLRQKLLPMNLEMQLFLKVNEKFWDENLVSQALNDF